MKFTVNTVLFIGVKTGNHYPIAERHLGLLNLLKGYHPDTVQDGLSATCPPDAGVNFYK